MISLKDILKPHRIIYYLNNGESASIWSKNYYKAYKSLKRELKKGLVYGYSIEVCKLQRIVINI